MKQLSPALIRIAALLAALLMGGPAIGGLTAEQLADLGVTPPPDAGLPLDAQLTDLDGRPTSLGEAIGDRPAVVVFADYDCPQLWSPILALAGVALGESGLRAGTDYRLVVIGFNPRATAADGRRMVDGQIGFSTPVGRATVALIASDKVAARLTTAVGFHYAYDPALARFAHPAALLVVTSSGRLSRVLSGLAITGADVRLALVEAGKGTIGAIADQVRLLCYGFSASIGLYTDRVRVLLMAAGVTTLFAMGAGLMTVARASARRRT
jgi:protein SCO1